MINVSLAYVKLEYHKSCVTIIISESINPRKLKSCTLNIVTNLIKKGWDKMFFAFVDMGFPFIEIGAQ